MQCGVPLALFASACLGCASPSESGARGSPYSLAVGRVLDVREVGRPPCPQDYICLDGTYRFRITVGTYSGREVPSPVAVEVELHGPPPRDVQLVLLVRRGGPGRPWIGRVLGAVRPGERACVKTASLQEVGLAPPKGASRIGDRLCFSI